MEAGGALVQSLRGFFHRRSNPPLVTDDGETAAQALDSLSLILRKLLRRQADVRQVARKVEVIWNGVFKQETAPHKKFELAEGLLHRTEVMRNLLGIFYSIDNEPRRKIRDLVLFLRTWTSNDAPDSSCPRSRAEDPAKKFSDLLYDCRHSFYWIVHEGRADTDSVTLFNDVIRVFVEDEECAAALFRDRGLDANGKLKRPHGCVWSVLARLLEVRGKRGFHAIAGYFDAMEIVFLNKNHAVISHFIFNNFTEFTQSINELIALNNFFIQARALHFVNELFENQYHWENRRKWMAGPHLIRLCVLSLQSVHKTVRYEAVVLLSFFVQNQRNAVNIHRFIWVNRDRLLAYCIQNQPTPKPGVFNGEIKLFDTIIGCLEKWSPEEPVPHEPKVEVETPRESAESPMPISLPPSPEVELVEAYRRSTLRGIKEPVTDQEIDEYGRKTIRKEVEKCQRKRGVEEALEVAEDAPEAPGISDDPETSPETREAPEPSEAHPVSDAVEAPEAHGSKPKTQTN